MRINPFKHSAEPAGQEAKSGFARYSTTGIAVRLFITCWLVYGLHFATDIVREIYPAVALGDHWSFRVDEYAYLHPDLFEKEGYGWHIGNNPGVSMLAAIPYAAARPVIDPIVNSVNASRAAQGLTEPPEFRTYRPNARKFYAEAWRRGLDVKLGLAAFVMHGALMAPMSALSVVVVFLLLRRLIGSDRTAFWLSLLYAFATPVFFRTGFLNHNLMLGQIAFLGFVTMWNAADNARPSTQARFLLGGLAGGTALLFDYSGVILLVGLFAYGLVQRWVKSSVVDSFRHGVWYVLGTLPPVGLLWFYQWASFGHPFYPGQHWMPPVEWIELGYQGYGFPQLELLLSLAFNFRYGLFLAGPVLILAVLAPFFRRGSGYTLPRLEMFFMLGLFVALWVFFSGSNYTRLQFNTGIRYMVPALPFMFVLATVALVRLPKYLTFPLAAVSLFVSWTLAMYRDVEFGPGLLNPILKFLTEGPQLPAFLTLSRMTNHPIGQLLDNGWFVTGVLLLTAAAIYGLWRIDWPRPNLKIAMPAAGNPGTSLK